MVCEEMVGRLLLVVEERENFRFFRGEEPEGGCRWASSTITWETSKCMIYDHLLLATFVFLALCFTMDRHLVK